MSEVYQHVYRDVVWVKKVEVGQDATIMWGLTEIDGTVTEVSEHGIAVRMSASGSIMRFSPEDVKLRGFGLWNH